MVCQPVFSKPLKKTSATPEDQANLNPDVRGNI